MWTPHQTYAKYNLLVHFLGDNLHWVPQAVLFLPKDEGGHGLMQMQSRTAAFRMQFIKRLLSGPSDVAWRGVSCSILKTCGGLGLDKSLFLMTPHLMDTSGLPPFYRSLFKIWDLFIVQRNGPVTSLHWLLQAIGLWSTFGHYCLWISCTHENSSQL